jgi:hypothetical protein
LSKGPGQTGTAADGGSFTVPNLIMAFLNDSQIAEMTAAMGISDHEEALPDTHVVANRLYNVAHFITMRGTVAFEVLNCGVGSAKRTSDETYTRVLFNDAVCPIATCQNGPGKSCLLSEYILVLKKKGDKLMKAGLKGAIT